MSIQEIIEMGEDSLRVATTTPICIIDFIVNTTTLLFGLNEEQKDACYNAVQDPQTRNLLERFCFNPPAIVFYVEFGDRSPQFDEDLAQEENKDDSISPLGLSSVGLFHFSLRVLSPSQSTSSLVFLKNVPAAFNPSDSQTLASQIQVVKLFSQVEPD